MYRYDYLLGDHKDYKHLWTQEQAEGLRIIKECHMAPEGYDFIIVTGTVGRGVDIMDERVQDWVCNAETYEDAVQFLRARFSPARKYLPVKLKGLIDFVQNGIPAPYYDWHNIDEMRALMKDYPLVKDPEVEEKKGIDWEQAPFETWNAAKKYYTTLGRVEERQYGRARIKQYRIKPA